MPCFIKLIRELGVTNPIGISLLDDYERLEELLKRRLNVDTHEEIHEVMKMMDAGRYFKYQSHVFLFSCLSSLF